MAIIGLNKKRELAPLLKEAIIFLTELSEDVHKLELFNDEKVSRRVKMAIMRFRTEGSLHKLETEIKKIRVEINQPKYKNKK